jgi:hypothetical protein
MIAVIAMTCIVSERAFWPLLYCHGIIAGMHNAHGGSNCIINKLYAAAPSPMPGGYIARLGWKKHR